MRNCLCLIFWLIYCVSSELVDDYDVDIGNPDDTAKILRPCRIYDLHCIRHFFAEHGKCKISQGPVPDPFIRAQSNLYAPRINVTFTLVPEVIRGLSGRIEEFYINKDTGKLVMAIEFRNFFLGSNNTYFTIYRRAKEPIVMVETATVDYESVIMTVIIPNLDHLELENAEIVAYSNDANPPVFIGPGILNSTDPQVQLTVTELLTDLSTTVQELYLTDAFFLAATYIQYNICDFGLKVL